MNLTEEVVQKVGMNEKMKKHTLFMIRPKENEDHV